MVAPVSAASLAVELPVPVPVPPAFEPERAFVTVLLGVLMSPSDHAVLRIQTCGALAGVDSRN
jgi:hypothetical protein